MILPTDHPTIDAVIGVAALVLVLGPILIGLLHVIFCE